MRLFSSILMLLLTVGLPGSGIEVRGQDHPEGRPLELHFKIIDEQAFLSHQRGYQNTLELDTSIKPVGGQYFTLNVAGKDEQFPCEMDRDGCNYYLGYVPTIDFYVVQYCGSMVCMTGMINKSNGQKCSLYSPHDAGSGPPLVAPDQKYFVTYVSSVLSDESFMALYKIDASAKCYEVSDASSFTTPKWMIDDLVWVDSHTLALKTYKDQQWSPETRRAEMTGVQYFEVDLLSIPR